MINSLQIDPRRRQAFVAGELVPLRERELDLLIFLAAHPGTVFTKEQLLAEVWGSCREWQTPRTVTEHVYRLRKRLGTEIGVAVLSHGRRGYSFQPSVVEAVG